MVAHKLTPEQKILSEEKRKQYQREYQKSIPIELKRIYEKRRKEKQLYTKQILKKEEKTV